MWTRLHLDSTGVGRTGQLGGGKGKEHANACGNENKKILKKPKTFPNWRVIFHPGKKFGIRSKPTTKENSGAYENP